MNTPDDPRPGPTRRTILQAAAASGMIAAGASLGLNPFRIPRAGATTPPARFSFQYNGTPSASLLPAWNPTTVSTPLDDTRTEITTTWTDPSTGLLVQQVEIQYSDYPATEWTVHFTNPSANISDQLSEVLAIDQTITGTAAAAWTVHTGTGANQTDHDFKPWDLPLGSGQYLLFGNAQGKSTAGDMADTSPLRGGAWPYYNVDWGNAGTIVALGWPGQWNLEMSLDSGGNAQILGGMTNKDSGIGAGAHISDAELTDMHLLPGEQIRTPLVVTMEWSGTAQLSGPNAWLAGQNAWRSWFLKYNTPRPGGSAPAPVISTIVSSEGARRFTALTAADDKADADVFYNNHCTPGNGGSIGWLWIDAGWYTMPSGIDPLAGGTGGDGWQYTGTWVPDPNRYPNGLIDVTNHVHSLGMKAIIWHEPERCRPGTDLADNHPDWLLPGGSSQDRCVNMGLPAARDWITDTFDNIIRDNGVDLFRTDFNAVLPLDNWNAADALTTGRRGATQIAYITGLLHFWDELRSRHPSVLIDNCASGGRRLDIESMRRSVVLLQSDAAGNSTFAQSQHMGLSLWIVCHGTIATIPTMGNASMYDLRSAMNWGMDLLFESAVTDPRSAAEWQIYQKGSNELNQIAENYFGDFYPLSPWSNDDSSWLAVQYDRPDLGLGQGIAQAFARPSTPTGPYTLKMLNLAANGNYLIADIDNPTAPGTYTGQQLMDGIPLDPGVRPYAVTVTYQRQS